MSGRHLIAIQLIGDRRKGEPGLPSPLDPCADLARKPPWATEPHALRFLPSQRLACPLGDQPPLELSKGCEYVGHRLTRW
jgi:hypothetical protein